MLKRAIATRYAKALFQTAEGAATLDVVLKDFKVFIATMDAEPELKSFLEHPAIIAEEKKANVKTLFAGKLNETLFDFICLIIDKKREQYLHFILEDYEDFLREHKGQCVANVFSPFALSADFKKVIQQKLSKTTGKTVELTEMLDDTLIGGIRIQIGDRIYDGSIRSRLDTLRDSLMNAKIQ